MDYSSEINKLLVLESNALYLLEVMDSVAKDKSVSKNTINSLASIGINLESYTGISIRSYSYETSSALVEPTLEGIGSVLLSMGKKIVHLIMWLAKVLFESISRLLHWIKNQLKRAKLGLDKAKFMKELAPAITNTSIRLGVSEKAIVNKINKTLTTAIPNTLSGGTVIPLNKTYVNLRSHYSVYFKESCLSKRQDNRIVLIFEHINKWIDCGYEANRHFRGSCTKLSHIRDGDNLLVPLEELYKCIPSDGKVPAGIDNFIKLSSTKFNSIDNGNRWNLFYNEAKDHHASITTLAAKDPSVVKENKSLPLEILNAHADIDVSKLDSDLREIENLYRMSITEGMSAVSSLSINNHDALEAVIRTSSKMKYLILGIHHCSLSLNEYLSAVDTLQQLKYSILEDVRHHLRVA